MINIYLLAALVLVLGIPAALFLWASSGQTPADELAQIITYRPSAEPIGESGAYSIMTYNLGYLSGLDNNQAAVSDERTFSRNLDSAVDLIQSSSPDILALQEIDFASRRSSYIDQLASLGKQLGFYQSARAVNWDKRYVPFPYGPPKVNFGPMLSGQAVLTNRPILDHRRQVLPRPPNPWYRDAFYLNRLAQVVKIDLGQPVIVINAHLENDNILTRQQQIDQLINIYNSYYESYPVLLVGDFNAVLKSADIIYDTDSSLERILDLPYIAEAGVIASPDDNLKTYRSDSPDRQLDHIFFNTNKILPLQVSTPPPGDHPSDHLPLTLKFKLK